MAYKKLWMRIPVLALVLGMTIIGCDNSGGTGDPNGGDSLPASSGSNVLSEKLYFEEREITTFSATADGDESGTYVVTTVDNGKYGQDDEFTFNTEIETGSYSWNEASGTVTLKPEKIVSMRGGSSGSDGTTIEIENNYGPLVDMAAYRTGLQTEMNQNTANMTQAEINAQLASMGFSSIADYVNSLVEESFSNRSYTYSFASDGTTLFLEGKLPANKGLNELSGNTYYYYYDERQQYVFTASGYTSTGYGTEITGSYVYDSGNKKVWLQPKTIDGKTRSEYYDSQTAESGHKYPDANTARASAANYAFNSRYLSRQNYDSEFKTIGSSGATTGSGASGTFNLEWAVIDTDYYSAHTLENAIYDKGWHTVTGGSSWTLAAGSEAEEVYNWCLETIDFVDSGTFSGSLSECLNFSNDGISAPAGLKTASKNHSRNMPLAGVFDGERYTVLFYLTKK